MVKQSPAQREKLTAWAVAKIADCATLSAARALVSTMRQKGAYHAPLEAAYDALYARCEAERIGASA